MQTLAMQVLNWQAKGDVGISSATMASIALGMKKNFYHSHFGYPLDPADFNRCMLLVDEIPEIKQHFAAISRSVPAFKGILDNWEELTDILRKEKKKGKSAPKTYARMQELLGKDA